MPLDSQDLAVLKEIRELLREVLEELKRQNRERG